jgi:hypothetical protein
MAKAYTPEGLSTRAFGITLAGVALFIAAVFIFIL